MGLFVCWALFGLAAGMACCCLQWGWDTALWEEGQTTLAALKSSTYQATCFLSITCFLVPNHPASQIGIWKREEKRLFLQKHGREEEQDRNRNRPLISSLPPPTHCLLHCTFSACPCLPRHSRHCLPASASASLCRHMLLCSFLSLFENFEKGRRHGGEGVGGTGGGGQSGSSLLHCTSSVEKKRAAFAVAG